MKSILPRRFELGVFIAMALVAGAVVAISPHHDTMLFFMAFPIFMVGALLGFRRSLVPVPVKETSDERTAIEERRSETR